MKKSRTEKIIDIPSKPDTSTRLINLSVTRLSQLYIPLKPSAGTIKSTGNTPTERKKCGALFDIKVGNKNTHIQAHISMPRDR